MSVTKIRPYGRVYDISMANTDISLTEIAVYGYICYRSGSSGSCFPSQSRIAADLGISRELVIATMKNLTRAGVITRQKCRIKGQLAYSYHYTYTLSTPSPLPKTYGRVTERMMSVCRNLSCGAIGLWFYLTSVIGVGTELYFTRADLSKRLNICSKTLSKYIKELMDKGEATALREVVHGCQFTRFIVQPTSIIPTSKNPTQTKSFLHSEECISPLLTPQKTDKAKNKIIKMNRKKYLSQDSERTREILDMYACNGCTYAHNVTFDGLLPHLQPFTSPDAGRAEYLSIIKTDLQYVLPHLVMFPRAWISDPLIRSAAIEVIFGQNKIEYTKIITDQLFWLLGSDDEDAKNRLLNELDKICDTTSKTSADMWLSVLSKRVNEALQRNAVRYPAAYVRRMIVNWLTDVWSQNNDKISYLKELAETKKANVPAPVPQTYEQLVLDPLCNPYREQIKLLSKQEYRELADTYEAMIRYREASGHPVTRFDIDFDEDILELYAFMPASYYEFLLMVDTNLAAAILSFPKQELDNRDFAYALLSPSERRNVLFGQSEYLWLIDPVCDNNIEKFA